RGFERNVRREELVQVDEGAAAGVLGALHRVQELSDRTLESRQTCSTQAAGHYRCSPAAPEAVVLDTRATAKSAPCDVEPPDSSGIEKPD
ncbi:unnamed protein product, partial [Ectocarpus sp. 12 AP-2014]